MAAPLLKPAGRTGRRRLACAVMRPVSRIATAAALLALAACGAGSDEGGSNRMVAVQEQESSAPSRASPVPAAGPASATDIGPATGAAPSAIPAGTARRCGWLHNPTPGNWWLEDRAGEWILAAQGGRQAAGMDDMPDMSTSGWVETNGHYGYGCACVTLTADPETREVAAVARPEPKPLAQCREDRTLPPP